MAETYSEVPPPPYARFTDAPPNYDADKALADFNALSPEKKAKFSLGVAQAASQDDAITHFKEAANAAATAADQIDIMFVLMTAKLMSLDDAQSFVKQFETIKGVCTFRCYRAVTRSTLIIRSTIAAS